MSARSALSPTVSWRIITGDTLARDLSSVTFAATDSDIKVLYFIPSFVSPVYFIAADYQQFFVL
jgi:hypothetical protein